MDAKYYESMRNCVIQLRKFTNAFSSIFSVAVVFKSPSLNCVFVVKKGLINVNETLKLSFIVKS